MISSDYERILATTSMQINTKQKMCTCMCHHMMTVLSPACTSIAGAFSLSATAAREADSVFSSL